MHIEQCCCLHAMAQAAMAVTVCFSVSGGAVIFSQGRALQNLQGFLPFCIARPWLPAVAALPVGQAQPCAACQAARLVCSVDSFVTGCKPNFYSTLSCEAVSAALLLAAALLVAALQPADKIRLSKQAATWVWCLCSFHNRVMICSNSSATPNVTLSCYRDIHYHATKIILQH